MKNLLILLLTIAITLPILFSCAGESGSGGTVTTTTQSGDNQETSTEIEEIKPDLPARDFEGREFMF